MQRDPCLCGILFVHDSTAISITEFDNRHSTAYAIPEHQRHVYELLQFRLKVSLVNLKKNVKKMSFRVNIIRINAYVYAYCRILIAN